MSIEARYCIRLDFEYPAAGRDGSAVDDEDDVDIALFELVRGKNIHDLIVCSGNVACDPYLTCWSALMEDAEFAQDQIIGLLVELGATVKGYTP